MTNPAVLERQLIHLDLRKGMNERVRPECGDPSSLLTRVENLLQDQDGSWVKRPGLQAMGGTIVSARRLVKLPGGGVGAVAGVGRFSTYSENGDQWVESINLDSDESQLPHFVTSVDQVAGSRDRSNSRLVSSASTSKYHFVITQDSTIGQFYVSVFDRATGSVIRTYDGTLDFSVGMVFNPMMTVIGDRYLVLFFGNPTSGGRLYCSVTDTDSTWQVNQGSPTTLATPGFAAAATPDDVAASSTNAFVASNGTIYSVNTAGALVASRALSAVSIACSPDKLWVATATNLLAVNNTNIASTVVASAAHGGAADGKIEVNDANRVFQTASGTVTMGTQSLATTETRITTADNGTTFGTASTIVGWNMESAPFFIPATDQVYVHVRKDEVGVTNSMHAIVNISVPQTTSGTQFVRFRADSMLEPFNGVAGYQVQRYTPFNNYSVGIPVSIQVAARSLGYSMFNLEALHYQKTGQCLFGEQALFGCGTPSVVGGAPREMGFVDMPIVDATDSGVAGTLSGAYKYLAVFRHVDETGAVTWSRVSPIESVTVASMRTDVYISTMAVGMRDASDSPLSVNVELYRTASGGTIYYLCGSSAAGTSYPTIGTSGNFWYIQDNTSDATLQTYPLLFRQPGTPNSPLDRYPCPPTRVMASHKDRVYVALGNHVYYSSFFVDGEGPWFHPQFGFYCHGGSGPITGLASMDGRLLVFKSDAVFVVDGDGPAEGGVVGNEFSPPQRIATEYGCVDHRSLQVFAGGCLYRSSRGIEQLTRGLELRNVGDRVLTTQEAYPYVIGSVIDSDSHYRLILSTAAPAPAASGQCVELVYDTLSDCWSTSKFTDSTAVYGACLQDIGLNDSSVVYADAVTGIYRGAGYLDGTTFVPWTLETGWIRTGQQARQLVEKLFFLGLRQSNHALKVEVAFNYEDSYTDTETWEMDAFDADTSVEEVCKNCESIQTLAAKFRISEQAPADVTAYPVGTGQGCDILGLTVQIAVKTGGPKVAKDQKG